MTGLNIQSLAHLGRGLERGVYQKGKLYSRRRTGCQDVKLLSVLRTKITSVTSLPSCHLTLRSSDCYPLPFPPPREGACHGLSSTLPCNDKTSSCNTQMADAAATLPHRGEGISNYNQIIYNNQPSPQPSPTARNELIHLFTYSLIHLVNAARLH